ncbi:hypothetical protein DXG01_016654 [Tephrocybe rancida]|nr:hypothetical protein DXG01_016654 [Tephrocybe rancida]
MRHAYIRLAMAMLEDEMNETIPEFQRFCLDIIAWLSYHLDFLPRLTENEEGLAKYPVHHDMMGAVTKDPTIVQMLHQMRIPVWRVVPILKLVSTINICSVIPLSNTVEILEQSMYNPPRIICIQHPGTLMHHAMQRVGCTFVDKIMAPLRGPRPEVIDIGPRSKQPPARFAPYPPAAPKEPRPASNSGELIIPSASLFKLLQRGPDVADPPALSNVSQAD